MSVGEPAAAPARVQGAAARLKAERLPGLIVAATILALMQVASFFLPAYIMPSPLAVAGALADALGQDWLQILVTLGRLFSAVLCSMLLGTLIGLAMGTFSGLRPYLRSLVIIDTGIPALSWMLVAVFWFKNPEARIFFILVVILIPFYALNVHDGIRALPKDWLEMCESFRPSRLQVLRYLIVPQLVPYVLMTTKSMIGYATRMVIFAELIGSAIGIGARMGLAEATFHMEQVIAWTVLLVILNLVLQALITLAELRLLKWRPEAALR